jgi:hypothetical protein
MLYAIKATQEDVTTSQKRQRFERACDTGVNSFGTDPAANLGAIEQVAPSNQELAAVSSTPQRLSLVRR